MRHVPGGALTAVPTGLAPNVITLLLKKKITKVSQKTKPKKSLYGYQLGRGHAIRFDEALQISKQLHGHRTYFLPGGAARIG